MKNIIKIVATGLVLGLASGSFAQTAKDQKIVPPAVADAKNVISAPTMADAKNDRTNLEQLRNHKPAVAKLVSKNLDNAKEQGFTMKDLMKRIAAHVDMRNSSQEKGLSPTDRHRTAVTKNAMRNRSFEQHSAAMRNRTHGVR